MKKGFTLIELMVSLIIGLILINFAFSYQFNLVDELKKLKSNENLAMHSFKLSEIIARGFKYDEDDIGGLITLKEYTNDSEIKNYTSLTATTKLSTTLENGEIVAKINDYIYSSISVLSVKFLLVKDMNGVEGGGDSASPWIYSIKIYSKNRNNNILNGKSYLNYTRLVYTK